MTHQALYVGISRYLGWPSHAQNLSSWAEAATRIAWALYKDEGEDPDRRQRIITGHPEAWVGNGDTRWPRPDGPDGAHLLTGTVEQHDLEERISTLTNGGDTGEQHLLFYFAGHGRVVSRHGRSDLLLATSDDAWDGDRKNPGSPRGVWASDLLADIRRAKPASATVILECCHAGLASRIMGSPRTGMVLLAATESDQLAIAAPEDIPQFTKFLITGLEGAASDIRGRITAMSLHTYVSGIMNVQRHGHTPIFKGSVGKPVTLHKVKGSLTIEDLDRLAPVDGVENGNEFAFPFPEAVIPAEGAWETTDEEYRPTRSRMPNLRNDEKTLEQRRMDYYNRLRKAGLAETTDGKDLFWTVMESIIHPDEDHGVRLTPLGRYYWELASHGQINPVDD